MLDRTLTPAGERRLKDLRCLGRGAEFAWPNPGVYSVVQLAEKILIGLAQQGRHEGPRDLLTNEELVIGLWLKNNQKPSLKSFRSELSEALKLAPLGLDPAQWREVIVELESHATLSSGDLNLWSERILLYLQAWAFAAEQGRGLSMWDAAYRVVREVEAAHLKELPWTALLERHPFLASDLRFVVPEVQDPQPLEEALLAMLPLPLERLSSQAGDFPLHDLAKFSDDTSVHSADDLAFAWAFEAKPPGPVETVTVLPGRFPVDVAVKTWEDDNEELRVLSLFCSSIASPENTQHAFFRHHQESRFLSSWRLGAETTASEILEAWTLNREPEFPTRLLSEMKKLSLEALSEVFALLAESPMFRIERRAFENPRLDPRGAPLLTLPDLPFAGARRFALWGVAKDFEKNLAPTSTQVLKSHDFPQSLRKTLTSHGCYLPDAEREQRLLLGALESLGDALCVIEPEARAPFPTSEPPRWTIDTLAARSSLSPSALEAYAECSARYYTERVLRSERVSDWDPVPLDALDTGRWVHAVLENFLEAPNWTKVPETLKELLEQKRTEIFSKPHSEAYRKILGQESHLLLESLERHVLNFEIPLLRLMGGERQLHAETEISGHFAERAYHGKIDRLDIYTPKLALLWDYKTGRIEQKNSLSQITNHKFQWHLYRALVHDAQPDLKIAGGGYLNPLDPSKSRLLIFDSFFPAAQASDFADLCESQGHRIERIESELKIEEALEAEVEALRLKMDSGFVAPEGDPAKTCKRCNSRGICGKPYLEGEPDDATS